MNTKKQKYKLKVKTNLVSWSIKSNSVGRDKIKINEARKNHWTSKKSKQTFNNKLFWDNILR